MVATLRPCRRAPRKRLGERGKPVQRRLSHDGDGLVGREGVTVVGEHARPRRVDQPVGRAPDRDVGLTVDERAVEEAEIHGADRGEARSYTRVSAG